MLTKLSCQISLIHLRGLQLSENELDCLGVFLVVHFCVLDFF